MDEQEDYDLDTLNKEFDDMVGMTEDDTLSQVNSQEIIIFSKLQYYNK